VIRRLFVALALSFSIATTAQAATTTKSSGQKASHPKGATTAKTHDPKPSSDKHKSSSDKKEKGTTHKPSSGSTASPTAPPTVKRDENGHIERSEAAKQRFMTQSGYPQGRPGYVVDHIRPLACGGADDPSNMQWQTVEAAKAKDKWERAGC